MNIFGWSYPPGCHGTPFDDPDPPCAICGESDVDLCECPECPECGDIGNPACYRDHSLRRTEEQRFNLEVNERDWQAENGLSYPWDDDWPEEERKPQLSITDPKCGCCDGTGMLRNLRNHSEQFTCPFCNGEGYISEK